LGGLTERQGVVAVVRVGERLLVIRRSQFVVAPGAYCFPGGGIEPPETEEQALVREFREELGALVEPLRVLWRSRTDRGVQLGWWLARLAEDAPLVPDQHEVESFHWMTIREMRSLADLLDSNRAFLDALEGGHFSW
jgi:8-oxo-dGTP diphosphatase